MEYDIQQLIERPQVHINLKRCLKYIKDKRVLITGAGGSIGSELSKQLIIGGAKRLYLLDHNENGIYEVHRSLIKLNNERKKKTEAIIPIVGELQDRDYIFHLIGRLKADVIFHTAAHKHVFLSEINPVEVIKNNTFGTKNLVDALNKEDNFSKLVFLSTDKSVDPVSTYGVSKRLAEEIVLNAGRNNHKFLVVRFGNVFGTNGSVINLFKEQIESGGPITITHKNVKRFFMSIHEAVSLVLKIGSIGKGEELYLLDMGEQISIFELAKRMIHFYEYAYDDIGIEFIGLKHGEKLEEKLYSDNDIVKKTRYKKILRVTDYEPIDNINEILDELRPICFFDKDKPNFFRRRNTLRTILTQYFKNLVWLDEQDY